MKKLNNKGFTLVELLAVIVILALVMGIAASYMISTMNESRQATLYSTAQNAAATLNSWIASDLLITDDDQRQLDSDFMTAVGTNTWYCMSDNLKIKNGTVGLLSALSLDTTDKDLTIIGEEPTLNSDNKYTATAGTTCSAIRYNTTIGSFEVLLVAKEGGKYYVSGSGNYAFSRAAGHSQPIA